VAKKDSEIIVKVPHEDKAELKDVAERVDTTVSQIVRDGYRDKLVELKKKLRDREREIALQS
jgi:cell division protein ZapA (FtsZ GTPase activity inhibitor)